MRPTDGFSCFPGGLLRADGPLGRLVQGQTIGLICNSFSELTCSIIETIGSLRMLLGTGSFSSKPNKRSERCRKVQKGNGSAPPS